MLDKKGFTSIELLVSFIIVSAIAIGLFDVVLNYKNKQQISSFETSLQAFINTTTKMIQDDLIKRRLTNASISGSSVTFYLKTAKDGSNQTHLVLNQSEMFIRYGATGKEIRYDFPKIVDLKIASYQFKFVGSGTGRFISLEIVLEHPNLNQKKRLLITAPVNYQESV